MEPIIPAEMLAVEATGFGIDALQIETRPVPVPKAGEILVHLAAATLNYRDLALLTGTYRAGQQFGGTYVPGSDGCGRVVAIGAGVTRFAVGDRAVPTYTQGWIGGLPTPEMRAGQTLGLPLDGVLRSYIAVPAEAAVHPPDHLSDMEAATLPIAALTAWTTLHEGHVQPGSWVLTMGTGGVALFALQFAKLAGARVVAISSSEEKLARARVLGADATINYRDNPDWTPLVRQATGGRGVDIVVETAGELSKSVGAAAFGGFVGVIGFTGGHTGPFDVRAMIGSLPRMQGIATGSRSGFEAMNRAVSQHGLKPVVEHVFPFEQTVDAFALLRSGGHFGKIGIRIPG